MSTPRCFTVRSPQAEPPLFQNGHLVLQPHDIGWIISGIFTIIATTISAWLISRHLMWYTNGDQQRYVVRLLFMVPIYAIISLASYIFWNHSVPITLIRDSYESFVIYSFFYLLLQYVSPTVEGQKDVFRNAKFQKWLFPLGFVKYRPRDGLYFLQLMKWGILQYCIIRPGTTVVAVILDFTGLYCEDSWSPRYGHVYITVLVSLSVSVAMYCLLQVYSTLATELSPHRPLLKFISIKSVVFLTFWQASMLSVLATFGLIKDTPTMTSDAVQNGIATILETVEMAIFALVHLKAFSYLDYKPEHANMDQRTSRWKSLKHVLDTREFWSELFIGSDYMSKTIRGIETDEQARRRMHFARVMGRERETVLLKGNVEDEGDSEFYPLTDANLYNASYKGKYSDLISDDLTESNPLTVQQSNRYINTDQRNLSRGSNKESISHMPASKSSHQLENTRDGTRMDVTPLKGVTPREIHNVPLEVDLLRSLQGEALPSIDRSHGTSRFLATNGSSRLSQYPFSTGDSLPRNLRSHEQSARPSIKPSRRRPPRIVLPSPLAHFEN